VEGHVEAFKILGGIPAKHIRHDNLKPAVRQVCTGRNRLGVRAVDRTRIWAVHTSAGVV
jgi:hypothetical protein